MKGGWRFKPTASVVCLFNIFTTLQPCWRIACIEGLTPHTGYQPMHWHYIIKVAICKYFAQIPIDDNGSWRLRPIYATVLLIYIYHSPPTRLASIQTIICKQHYIPTHIKTKYILSKILPPQKPRFQNKFPDHIPHTPTTCHCEHSPQPFYIARPACHCKPAWQHIIAHTLKQSNFPVPSPKIFPQLQ